MRTILRSLALLWALLAPGAALAQGQVARFTLGVAGQPVAEAWNQLRLELRDAPPATLTLQIDQGTLRSGEVPLTITHAVRGGAGISIFERTIFLPRFARLTWRLATTDRVLASGSLPGREVDTRPLDLLLSGAPGAYRSAYEGAVGPGARLVDVAATDLPTEPAAYDGVRSLLIDGTAAAPRLEAVAAAAAGGAVVVLRGPLPSSHSDLLLLLGGAEATRLGAGAVLHVEADAQAAVEAMAALQMPGREALLAALLAEPLVRPDAPVRQLQVALVLAAYALATLLLLRWAGTPGLVAALALAGTLSLVGWRLLRPAAPQLEGQLTLALAGDGLALESGASELLTMPRATLNLSGHRRPLRPTPYLVDDGGTHVQLERWRAVMFEAAPTLSESPLVFTGASVGNVGRQPVFDLTVVGTGPVGDLPPGAATPTPTESGAWPRYEALIPLLPDGAVVGRSACDATCTVWVLFPPLHTPGPEADDAATAALPPIGELASEQLADMGRLQQARAASEGVRDPFRSAPAAAQEAEAP